MTRKSLLMGSAFLSAATLAGASSVGRPSAFLHLGSVRALVISPHPDDATLGAGGLIERVLHQGGKVRVVQMTDGDAFSTGVMTIRHDPHPTALTYRWYASLREREEIQAMHHLGVSRPKIRFLGFPDDGLCVLASRSRTDTVFESPYTKRTAPPEAEQIVPGTTYRGDDVIRELARLIDEFRPTLLVLPHAGDEHPDHCATHRLVHLALADAIAAGRRPPRVLHYIVHYPKWLTMERASAQPSSSARSGDWHWETLRLTSAEQTGKRLALEAFRSQMLMMPEFLHTFEQSSEVFIEGEPTQPVWCWCGSDFIESHPIGVQ